MKWVLATTNYGVARYSYEDPRMAGFVDNLDRINALADVSPGFVWRYIADDDDAEAIRVFANPAVLFNLSTWESIEALRQFSYESDHVEILRRRAEWFEPQSGPTLALWWQPADLTPTVMEARHRLECLAERGPGPDAFTFRNAFDPPEG